VSKRVLLQWFFWCADAQTNLKAKTAKELPTSPDNYARFALLHQLEKCML